MKICTKCKESSTGKRFCKKCSTELVEGIFCDGKNKDGNVCGEILILEPGDNYCDACGHDVRSVKQQKDSEPAKLTALERHHEVNDDYSKQDDPEPKQTTELNQDQTNGGKMVDCHDGDTKSDDDDSFEEAEEEPSRYNVQESEESKLNQNEFKLKLIGDDPGSLSKNTATKSLAKSIQVTGNLSSQVLVDFKAIILPEIKFDPLKDDLVLKVYEKGELQKVKKFHQSEIETRKDEENSGCVTVISLKMSLSRSSLMTEHVTHQYVLHRKIKVEYAEQRQEKTTLAERKICIPTQYHQTDNWVQFDGVLYKETKEKKEHKLLNLYKFLDRGTKETDVERSARIHGLVIVDSIVKNPNQTTVSQIRQTCAQLFIGLENKFLFDNGEKHSIRKKMHLKLWLAFENYLKNHFSHDEVATKRKLLLLESMLYLFKEYRIDLNEDSMNLVCDQFMMNPIGNRLIEWEILEILHPTERKDLCDAFLNFSLAVESESKNPKWFYLLPYIHFLNGQSKPFDKTPRDASHDARDLHWWGIKEGNLGNTINIFKKKRSPWSKSIQRISENIQHLFNVDYLLPRTIVAALAFDELKDVIQTNIYPAEVTCAALYFYIKDQEDHSQEDVLNCLQNIYKQISGTTEKTGSDVKRWLKATISGQLLSELTKKSSPVLHVCQSADIFTWCMSVYNHSLQENNQVEKEQNLKCIKDAAENVVSWCKRVEMSATQEVQVWNDLLMKVESTSDVIAKAWNNELNGALIESLTKRIDTGDSIEILSLYCKSGEKLKKDMMEILCSIVQKAVLDTEELDTSDWIENEKLNLLILMKNKFFTDWNTIAEANKEMNITTYLNWPSLPFFIRILYQEESLSHLKSTGCKDKLHGIKETMETVIEHLCKGSIAIHELRLLCEQEKRFCDITAQFECSNFKRVSEVLKTRMCEFQQFCSQKEYLEFLKSLCTSLPSVDTGPIDEILQRETEYCALDQIIVVTKAENSTKTDKVKIVSNNTSLIKLLTWIQSYKNSQCFRQWWNEECKKQPKGVCQAFADIETHVMVPLEERMMLLSDRISSGEITFREIEQLFGELFHDKYEIMRQELAVICKDVNCVDRRIEQLRKHRSYKTMNDVARVMMDLKEVYCLNGNFKPFKTLLDRPNEDKAFKDFEESLSEVGDLLEGMTPMRIKCLQTFVKCQALVNWLRESMKQFGLKEFLVIVDLATISAGESAEKMAKVKSLHAGVNAYASLIFDLKTEDGYMEVIKYCELAWKVLDETPTIQESLLFANQHLQWFKHVKDTRGEVEITSFMEANTINEFGIFTIGTDVGKNLQISTQYVGTNDDLFDVIKLTVPADEEQGRMEVSEYCLSELEELQSKLMLVAGEADKGRASVERFTMVLDGVIRLSQVYIRLVSSGCVLFTNFAIKLFCEPNLDTPVCVILEFKNGEELTQLKCRKTKEERLEDIMPKIASQMEKCLKDWKEFVDHNRSEYPHLNYFTMDQLVIIQKEIAKICHDKEESQMLFPLLQFVKSNCNKDDVIEANAKAEEDCKTKQKNSQNETEKQTSGHDNPDRDKFINKLVNANYERLVPFALKEFPDYDTGRALFWCMKNKNNLGKLEAEFQEPTDVRDDLATGNNKPADTIAAVVSRAIANEGQYDRCENMLQKFEKRWRDFIQAIIWSLEDFISLKQLGVLLRHLANKENSHHIRTLPDSYDESFPNLVICPTDEVLITTLSVYMMDISGEDLLLPQSDEVLMCSANTSLEKVDIFLRRAIFFSNGKIHCIVNADLMDFHVCDGLHDRLQEYIRKVDEKDKYRLIIICGSEKEHSLSMISSLEKYRKFPLKLDSGRVKTNIENKLKLDAEKEKAAAAVDFGRSTVRLVLSRRSGVGKTLYKKRTEENLKKLTGFEGFTGITLPLHHKKIDIDNVIGRFLEHTKGPDFSSPRLFHIDVTNEVKEGVDFLLFNLLILGCLVHKNGYIWRKSCYDLYLVETMVKGMNTGSKKDTVPQSKHQMINLLPAVTCRSPEECVKVYKGEGVQDYVKSDQLFDRQLYESDLYQKPYICLLQLESKDTKDVSPQDCLETLLRACRVMDPSWSEMYHFVSFLHTQLVDFEKNSFVGSVAQEDLPGFSTFVKKFLIQMSKEFSSRSLNMSEETDYEKGETESDTENELCEYQMKRTWESSPHPYLFFNADHFTFTFIGFNIDRESGNLIDVQTDKVLEEKIISQNLFDQLVMNRVPIQEEFDKLSRAEKIERLCIVMGIPQPINDPDITYELTTDNVKKMMAIYMRFRCDIPVIIMGETGCGKTRLVKFLCDLMASKSHEEEHEKAQNMIIVKVHGGTTNQEISSKVTEAENVALENLKLFGENMFTVLFFDEANTTESIGLLKEIICDKTMDGLPLKLCRNLKLVAACNPYRRHPKNLIEKLEKAGLGYHVHVSDTSDRLAGIPLRRLVYRVQPLPQSLLPFVWDFGQLTTEIEELYIQQMVKRFMKDGRIPNDTTLLEVISEILTRSQQYMRTLKDECSFVSLRDVDRVLQIMCWFYSRPDTSLFKKADENLKAVYLKQGVKEEFQSLKLSKETRSLVLALGVCYHACLNERDKYRKYIAEYFRKPCILTRGPDQIREEIDCCQEAMLDAVSLESDIAKNLALKENVFMMVVCIELRIPLFLVGKPGSSKSLARLTVADAMQGNAAKDELFKEMKQVQMLSFQCSPHSTPAGISTTFRQCADFQKNNNLDKFVSVVVLDEVGLAEDSPKLPLKTLHPLLEDGCQGEEKPEPHKKVGFIGISNWALDPAKMNRGIFVQRGVPDPKELEETATGICQKTLVIAGMNKLIQELSTAYLKVFKKATETKREFFGLRDFYCLMKMVNKFADDSRRLPSFHQLRFALRRNFSGLETMDSVDVFFNEMTSINSKNQPEATDPDDSFKGLIDCCLEDTNSRHLLLITENYSALTTFQQYFLARKTHRKTTTIFGSSFRRDQEYTQVCRSINRIKICMETGNTVILLNSENLYESLYEALNQYYVLLGGQKYVDLGLGTHRVKCPVHDHFKLIVVAEKQTVYDEFPIPLINRLEKHNLTSNTMLSNEQKGTALLLKQWTRKITGFALEPGIDHLETDVGKVIIGFHDDACSAVVLNIWDQQYCNDENEHKKQVLEKAKEYLLWCATPDAIVRISNTSQTDKDIIEEFYWVKQAHESITEYLQLQLVTKKCNRLLAQVTTRTKLLTTVHRAALSQSCGIPENQVCILESLTTFDTEQQFNSKIRDFLRKARDAPVLLVIQCDTGDENLNLIACARHSALDECSKADLIRKSSVHIVVIVQLTTFSQRDFKSIQCGEWHSVHIDHLHSVSNAIPSFLEMQGKSIATLIYEATREVVKTEMYSRSVEPNEGGCMSLSSAGHLVESRRCIDLKQILSMCVQRAMSMVRDTGEGGFQITNTISLVLNLLHSDDFTLGVGKLLACLLEDKDRSSVPTRVKNWLPAEAATVEMIQRTGTLRRACLQTFESKLSPVLAGIIALLNTNKNINILSEKGTWKTSLWIQMLNRTDIFNATYEEVVQTESNNQVDFIMHGTGFEGHHFQSQMPFSWLISRKLSEILECDSSYLRKFDGTYSKLAFEDTPILKELLSVSEESINMALDCYIYDFVHTVYLSEGEDEMTIVCEMMKQESFALHSENEKQSLPSLLMNVHIAFKNLSSKLKCFREINHVWKECSHKLISVTGLPENHALKVNQCTDKVKQALYLLIENLSPLNKDVFDNSSMRSTWLVEVHRYRHVVQQTFTSYSYDEENETAMDKTLIEARSLWNCVIIMQLFLENICKSSGEESITIEFCCPLWMQLKEDKVDMKKIATIGKVEEFLKTCFVIAKSEYEKKLERCSHCSKVLSDTSRKLQCMHEICYRCIQTMRNQDELFCPTCQIRVDSNYWDNEENRYTSVKDKLEDYKRRCTKFFMDIVSQLCFSDDQAPDTDVVEKLMRYSLGTELTSTGVDSSHAFKTFIFKLLIRTSEKEFRHQLERHLANRETYATQAEHDAVSKGQEDILFHKEELLIIAYCIEDNISERNYLKHLASLKEAKRLMYKTLVDQFQGIALARICLASAAQIIYCQVNEGKVRNEDIYNRTSNTDNEYLRAVKEFCDETEQTGSWKYLVKYLYRFYGFDILNAAFESSNPAIHWINKDELKSKETDRIDRYIICGKRYRQCKEYVVDLTETQEAQDFADFARSSGMDVEHAFVYLHMAIYWEIAVSKSKTHVIKVKHMLGCLKDSNVTYGSRTIVKALANNNLQRLHVEVDIETKESDVNIKCLVFQWISILFNIEKSQTCALLKPLVELAKQPKKFLNAFLPTMEEDEMHELIALLREGQQHENQEVYRCENGHPYVIRDCGRPWVTAKCPCGSKIGGKSHRLDRSNVQDDGSDKTLTGHILGLPAERKNRACPERDLKPINCSCIRFLLHLTMYAACAAKNSKDVHKIVKTEVEQSQTIFFVHGHIQKDIEDIQGELNLNLDEVLVFCHHLLDSFLEKTAIKATTQEDIHYAWSSKENRRKWENNIDEKYVQPVVKDCIGIISSASKELKKSNELVSMLSESRLETEDENTEYLCNNPMFWMYRVPVTFTNMKHIFEKTYLSDKECKQFPLLKRFFEEEHILKAIRFIPSILKLQRILLRKFSQRFYKKDIAEKTIGTLKQEKLAGEETEVLLKNVIDAWDLTRQVIGARKHVCLTEMGRVLVPKELCDVPFTEESPMEVLLPSTDDKGICSFAMLDILMKIQNEFLDEYLRISHLNGAKVSPTTVRPREISSAHLISFDPLLDIQPLILANCSFDVQDSNIVYEFENFEKQLIDRFVSTKSKLEISPFMEIDTMVYRTDVFVSAAMMTLKRKIKQVPVTPVMRNQICGDIKDIPDICQILSDLDIAIKVLNVTGGGTESLLYEFMVDKLRMNKGILTSKIQKLCKLCHVQSLWMTLSIQKAFIMITHNKSTKDIFETVDSSLHEPVPKENQAQLALFLQRQSDERLHVVLDVLYEYIILRAVRKQNEEDDDYIDESVFRLKDCIVAYASEIDREEEIEFVTYDTHSGFDFPDEILQKHCLSTWALIVRHITQHKAV